MGPCRWGCHSRVVAGLVGLVLGGVAPAYSSALPAVTVPTSPDVPHIRPSAACPADLETLVAGLVRDLPGYANRVASRTLGGLAAAEWPFGGVLMVGEPELEPIDLSDRTFRDLSGAESATAQVFFTTLERQYVNAEPILLQHYHWLFLAPGDRGWLMVFMFSSVGPYPANGRAPSPPQDSTNGIIGQAVGLWLRDCRARSVYPVSAAESLETGL
ncbi:MAG: hypothetical protein ICV62_05050 [Cyanobacteria bacterium Co-bin13]|nr:hypothetical protein [Cyanobacteria bacterium Co-bin13]